MAYTVIVYNFPDREIRMTLIMRRESENAAVVDEMEGHLIASGIHGKAKEICGDLATEYSLQAASVYYNEIGYDAWDPSDYEGHNIRFGTVQGN